MNALIYALLLFAASVLCIVLALMIWQRRETRGIVYYTVVLLAVSEWSVASGISYLVSPLRQQIFIVNFQFIGIALVPVMWYLFVLNYTGRGDRIKTSRLWLLAVHPVLLNIVVWTDPWHHLFRTQVWIDASLPLPYVQTLMGPLFWIHVIYSYGFLLVSTYLLWTTYTQAHGVYRKQAFLLLVGAIAPWVSNFIFIFGLLPGLQLDLTPFAFTLTAFTAFIALQRYGLFELLPIARDLVIEHLEDLVFVLDSRDRIIDANPAAHAMTGMAKGTLIGQHITRYIPGFSLLVTQSERDVPILLPLQFSPDKATAIFDVRLYSLSDDSQNRQGRILNLRDVTNQQRARETLASYAERLRVLHTIDQAILAEEQPEDIANAGLWGLHNILDYSAAAVFTRDEVDGYDFLAIHNQRGRDSDLEGWLLALKPLNLSAGLPLRKLNLSAETLSTPLEQYLFDRGVHGYLVLPMLVANALMGALVFEFDARDAFTNEQLDAALQVNVSLAVTLHNANLRLSLKHELEVRQRTEVALRVSEAALRDYAAELEVQNAELDAFAHTVAHDLKQPLAQLLGYSTLLEAEHRILPEDTFLLCVSAISSSARKMNSITGELLLLASVRKLEDVDTRPVNMADVIPEVLQRLERMVLMADAKIRVAETWPMVLAYAPWLEEVWANYLSNAIKYGGAAPRIELGWNLLPELKNQPTYVRFWVRDYGKGLSAEEQSRLFVPFERLEQVRSQGHGLGLSIVQRIVTRMGGQVGVESSGIPGEGSLFYFSLALPE